MPTPTDDEFKQLTRWYARLEPARALDLSGESSDDDHRWYVALDAWTHAGETHELRGPPAIPRIVSSIRLTASRFGAASTHLFSGFRGTGKTTELSRLAHELQNLGDFAVLRISARRYHPLTRALTVEELALLLAAGIGEAAAELLGAKQLDEAAKESVWKRVVDGLGRAFKATNLAAIKLGPFELRSALWQGESASANIRKLIGGRADLVKEFLHEFVREIASDIHPRQIVVLVDDLEKYDAPTDRVGTIYREMADLFFNSTDVLALPNCHVVYTVPPYLSFIHAGIGEKYEQRVHVLPSIKLRTRPPTREPFAPGIAALHALLAERVDLDLLFGAEHEACVGRLIAASGGNLRDLFSLVRLTIESALASLPVGTSQVERAIQQVAALRPLLKEPFLLLQDVDRQGDLTDIGADRQTGLALAMDQHLLLSYWNGEFWYDTHPLVEPQLERHRKPEEPEPGG